MNLPIAALACFVTWRGVPESRGAGAERGRSTARRRHAVVGLIALLLALDQVTDWGWTDPRILGLFALCVVLLVAFVFIERRAGAKALMPARRDGQPGLPLGLPGHPADVGDLLRGAALPAAVHAEDPRLTRSRPGAGLLPMMGVFAAISFVAGPLYERLGAKAIVTRGRGVPDASACSCSRWSSRDSGWAELVPGMVVMGIGVGLFYSSITTAAVTALDPSRSSLAGGIVYMFQIAGGSIGLGLTTTVFTTASEDKLQSRGDRAARDEIEEVHGVLAGTDSAAAAARPRRRRGGRPAASSPCARRSPPGCTWAFRARGGAGAGGAAWCRSVRGGR